MATIKRETYCASFLFQTVCDMPWSKYEINYSHINVNGFFASMVILANFSVGFFLYMYLLGQWQVKLSLRVTTSRLDHHGTFLLYFGRIFLRLAWR